MNELNEKPDYAEARSSLTADDYRRRLLQVYADGQQINNAIFNALQIQREIEKIKPVPEEKKDAVREIAPQMESPRSKKRTTVNEPEFLQTGNPEEESKIELTVTDKDGQKKPLRKREVAVLIKRVEDNVEDAVEEYLRPTPRDTGLDFYRRSVMPDVVDFKDKRTVWGRMDYIENQQLFWGSENECPLVVLPPGHPDLRDKYGLPRLERLKGQVALLMRPQEISRQWAAVQMAYFLPVMNIHDQVRSRVMMGGNDLAAEEDFLSMALGAAEQMLMVQRITNNNFLENLRKVFGKWTNRKGEMTKLMLFGAGNKKSLTEKMYADLGLKGYLNLPSNMVERALLTQVAISGINIISAAEDFKKSGISFLEQLANMSGEAR